MPDFSSVDQMFYYLEQQRRQEQAAMKPLVSPEEAAARAREREVAAAEEAAEMAHRFGVFRQTMPAQPAPRVWAHNFQVTIGDLIMPAGVLVESLASTQQGRALIEEIMVRLGYVRKAAPDAHHGIE